MAGYSSAQSSVGAWRRVAIALTRFWNSVTLRILLITTVVGLVLWQLWGPRVRDAHLYPDFGDLGGWVQGIGSFAAVVVALAQSHQLQVARLEDLRRQEQQQRTQVYGWVSYREDDSGEVGWYVNLNNMTPAPIGAWVFRISDAESGREVAILDVTKLLPIYPGLTRHYTGITAGELLRPTWRLEFVDAVGRCWRRDPAGALSEIADICIGDQALATSVRPI